jgi:Kef-type K+ transport system membrane component KefB
MDTAPNIDDYLFLLTLGGVLISGLVISAVGQKTHLPRVTLLLIFGVVIGKGGLDVIPIIFSNQFEIISEMALMMVGFLLGGRLTVNSLKSSLNATIWISIAAAVITALIVALALIFFGIPLELAIVLGCLASATDPAAILDVTQESNYTKPFKNQLLSIVSLDDAWALMLFGMGIALVSTLITVGVEDSALLMVAKDIGGAILIGLCIGFPAAYLTGRVKPGQPILSEALGAVFICGGLALWLGVSFLIASMVLGAVVGNVAKHHEQPLHAIEGIEWPFMVVFFVLAGANLEVRILSSIGLICVVYIIFRIVGKMVGARIGGQFGKADSQTKRWMGVALLPQAGVAIGMALVASNFIPEYRQTLLSVVVLSTVLFEIMGPIFTRLALERVEHA